MSSNLETYEAMLDELGQVIEHNLSEMLPIVKQFPKNQVARRTFRQQLKLAEKIFNETERFADKNL